MCQLDSNCNLKLIMWQGFDEFMNLVIDDAVEVQLATKDAPAKRRQLGQILLKGDNVSLIQSLD
jgi:small nuclear ribonucleoprotein E